MKIWPTVLITVALMAPAMSGQQHTLLDVLKENHLEATRQLPRDLLNATITGYAVETDSDEFVLAFLRVPDGASPPESHVILLNRVSGRWRHVDISDETSPANSITAVKRTRGYIYADSHINPSAGRLIVLSKELKLLRGFDGWALKVLPNDTVVYHHNQVHFAPTHSLEISIFSPRTLKNKQIYPPMPYQQVRRDFIRRVAEAYKQRGEEWFRAHNHHMNAESFDSAVVGDVISGSGSNTIAFLVRFGDPENVNDRLEFSEEVVVTCTPVNRVEEIQCRERRLQDWRQALHLSEPSIDQVLKGAAANPLLVR